jgi:hypothetical protein
MLYYKVVRRFGTKNRSLFFNIYYLFILNDRKNTFSIKYVEKIFLYPIAIVFKNLFSYDFIQLILALAETIVKRDQKRSLKK